MIGCRLSKGLEQQPRCLCCPTQGILGVLELIKYDGQAWVLDALQDLKHVTEAAGRWALGRSSYRILVSRLLHASQGYTRCADAQFSVPLLVTLTRRAVWFTSSSHNSGW